MKVWQYIAIGAGSLAALLLAFWLGRKTAVFTPVEPLSRDTVVVTRIDTIVREKPVYYAVTRVDTMLVPVTDTVRLRDTLYVVAEREQKAYRDSLYEAWVSGYRPALDSIRIYAPVQIVTVTEQVPVTRRTHWGICISAGYGATLQDKAVRLSPYIGIGVSYNLLSW